MQEVRDASSICLCSVEGLDSAVAQLVQDCEVDAMLSCADSHGIELEVQTTRVESGVVELLEPWHLGLFNKRVVEDEARATKALQLSCKGESGRVAENTLARLEANTDNEDARTSRASSTSGTAAVKLLCQSGRTVTHKLCGTLEDR